MASKTVDHTDSSTGGIHVNNPSAVQPSRDKSCNEKQRSNGSTPTSSEGDIPSNKNIKQGSGDAERKQDSENPHSDKTQLAEQPRLVTQASSIEEPDPNPSPSEANKNKNKNKKKKNKSKSSKKLAANKINELPTDHIRWEGLEEVAATPWYCASCERDLAYYSPDEVDHRWGYQGTDEAERSLYARMGLELEQCSLRLPEASVLPCGHAFHTTCLCATATQLITDPPCPICTIGT